MGVWARLAWGPAGTLFVANSRSVAGCGHCRVSTMSLSRSHSETRRACCGVGQERNAVTCALQVLLLCCQHKRASPRGHACARPVRSVSAPTAPPARSLDVLLVGWADGRAGGRSDGRGPCCGNGGGRRRRRWQAVKGAVGTTAIPDGLARKARRSWGCVMRDAADLTGRGCVPLRAAAAACWPPPHRPNRPVFFRRRRRRRWRRTHREKEQQQRHRGSSTSTECSDNPPAKTAHTHASHHQTCSFSHKVQRLSGGTSVTCPSTHHIHPLPSPPFPCFAGTRASGRALHTGPLLHVRTAYTSCTKYVLYESSPPVRIMYARRKCRVFFVPLVRAECNPETRGGESGDTLAQGYFDCAPHVVAPPPPPIDVGPACWSCTQVSASSLCT